MSFRYQSNRNNLKKFELPIIVGFCLCMVVIGVLALYFYSSKSGDCMNQVDETGHSHADHHYTPPIPTVTTPATNGKFLAFLRRNYRNNEYLVVKPVSATIAAKVLDFKTIFAAAMPVCTADNLDALVTFLDCSNLDVNDEVMAAKYVLYLSAREVTGSEQEITSYNDTNQTITIKQISELGPSGSVFTIPQFIATVKALRIPGTNLCNVGTEDYCTYYARISQPINIPLY